MLAVRNLCRRRLLCRGNATLQQTPSPTPQIPASLLTAQPPVADGPVRSEEISSTLAPAEPSAPSPDPNDAQTSSSTSESAKTTRKKVFYPRRRPNISLENPRKWNPPVKKDLIPAYDEAIKYINRDSARLRTEMSGLRKQIRDLESQDVDGKEEQLRVLQDRVGILEVQSYVNLPEVRWKAANGMGEPTNILFHTHLNIWML